jgi:GT2 family glycosyltransferase
MVGLPWEQHITFLDDPGRPARIEASVAEGVRACLGHPAVLCYAVGNEIPAPIVRWHGRRAIERFINYPTTEYLQLPFLDLHCFNVFLEQPGPLRKYLARLQNIAGEKPLILTEIGLDSRANGVDGQAMSVAWQIDTAIRAGCAGAVVFAWTDEWYRGGEEIWDWDFGLTDRLRQPKPALWAAGRALSRHPADLLNRPPKISVAVCACNTEKTIGECLEGISNLNYPDYEVIVVDDGSSDRTAEIAEKFLVKLVRTENMGLSSARNAALAHATGDIIAYIDSDAYPDSDWLAYLAEAYADGQHAAVGGPNIVPLDAGFMETCVANGPGGPVHVLLDDEHAEHIPGCNMSFRVGALEAIGGFDTQFGIAGDDVDACWRIQEAGGEIGFKAAATVFHHSRDTFWGYWKQQLNYGRAEAMLERKWPGKYNEFGHPVWSGRIYGSGHTLPVVFRRWRIYYGIRGSAPFQTAYENGSGPFGVLPLMPEWFLAVAVTAGLAALGALWSPLLVFVPVLVLLLAIVVAQAFASAVRVNLKRNGTKRWSRFQKRATIAGLHLAQPVARLLGRIGYNLTPWRRRGVVGISLPRRKVISLWSERWHSPHTWLEKLDRELSNHRVVVRTGGPHDRWDLEAWCGLLGGVRVLLTSEDHSGGRQLVRLRVWPRPAPATFVGGSTLLTFLGFTAAFEGAWIVVAVLAILVVVANVRLVFEQGAALRSVEECMLVLQGRFNAVPVDEPGTTDLQREQLAAFVDRKV